MSLFFCATHCKARVASGTFALPQETQTYEMWMTDIIIKKMWTFFWHYRICILVKGGMERLVLLKVRLTLQPSYKWPNCFVLYLSVDGAFFDKKTRFSRRKDISFRNKFLCRKTLLSNKVTITAEMKDDSIRTRTDVTLMFCYDQNRRVFKVYNFNNITYLNFIFFRALR